MGLDFRIMSASTTPEEYQELSQAFPSTEERDVIAEAMNEPLPSPLVYAYVAAKRKIGEIISPRRKGVNNGEAS